MGNLERSGVRVEEEGSDHSIYYLTSSPFSLFSTKLMLLLQTHKSLPVLANTPGVCLPLPSQVQEFAQGTIHHVFAGSILTLPSSLQKSL